MDPVLFYLIDLPRAFGLIFCWPLFRKKTKKTSVFSFHSVPSLKMIRNRHASTRCYSPSCDSAFMMGFLFKNCLEKLNFDFVLKREGTLYGVIQSFTVSLAISYRLQLSENSYKRYL